MAARKGGGPPPTKRTPERRTAILNSLRVGNTRRAAVGFAQIDHATFYRWMDDDATLRDDVEKAEADAETRFLGNIAKAAADGTWTAAAWWLERRRYEEYRRRDSANVRVTNGVEPEAVDVDADTVAAIERYIASHGPEVGVDVEPRSNGARTNGKH